MEAGFLPRAMFQRLLDVLHEAGYRCIGPQLRDNAVVYDTLTRVGQLPQGARDRQAPGSYRIENTAHPRVFSWANGPQALKPFLFAPREPLWRSERASHNVIRFTAASAPVPCGSVVACRTSSGKVEAFRPLGHGQTSTRNSLVTCCGLGSEWLVPRAGGPPESP